MSLTTEHLEELGVEFEVLPPEGGVQVLEDGDLPVRTVVLDLRTGHALAVIPRERSLDIAAAREAVGSSHVEIATPEEIAEDFPEFADGRVPPLGAWMHLPVLIDEEVTQHEHLVFEDDGGSVRVAGRDVFEPAQIRVAPICHR